IYGEGDSASNNSALVYAIRGDQAENYINYLNRDSGGTNNAQFNSNGSGNDYADGNWHLGVAALRSKSATDMTHWVDGEDVTITDASTGAPGASTIDRVRIGTVPRGTPIEYYDEDLGYIATFNRALTQAEAQQLTADPWGWLTPAASRFQGFRPRVTVAAQLADTFVFAEQVLTGDIPTRSLTDSFTFADQLNTALLTPHSHIMIYQIGEEIP
ncbi:hypothetical protein LCGC14_2384600, partial [marine sediment metagenome]